MAQRMEKALAACKKHRAKLVIAKLDRLSRNLATAEGGRCSTRSPRSRPASATTVPSWP
jgi:hypothetical protein